ncbi:ATP-binding protein, partial [Acinetobacter baumannii]
LGLTICKQLAGMMGGGIAVSSEPGRGSEFRASLPFTLVAAVPAIRLPQAGSVPDSLRLFVIDDHPTSRAYICKTIL